MKILVTNKTTGKFIEMRSFGDIETVSQDHNNDPNIEVKFITDEEWEVIETELKTPSEAASALSKLKEIDLASIRSLREWLAAQPDAPSFILDHEAAAIAERVKLQ